MEVLEDTLEEGNVDVGIRKTNTVTVNIMSRHHFKWVGRLTPNKHFFLFWPGQTDIPKGCHEFRSLY
jgi:hypothetical protein